MNFISFKSQLQNQIVFTLNDITKIDSKFYRARLNNWQKKGYIRKIIKGYYLFTDTPQEENLAFFTANTIYSPSYISLETALSYHNLIPEGVFTITSVGTQKTMNFETHLAHFSYKSLKKSLFWGYDLIPYNHHVIKMAQIEKALLDYLYLHPDLKNQHDFASLRINREEFKANFDLKKFQKYTLAFDTLSLQKRSQLFLQYIESA